MHHFIIEKNENNCKRSAYVYASCKLYVSMSLLASNLRAGPLEVFYAKTSVGLKYLNIGSIKFNFWIVGNL